jgi:hypothetical protein
MSEHHAACRGIKEQAWVHCPIRVGKVSEADTVTQVAKFRIGRQSTCCSREYRTADICLSAFSFSERRDLMIEPSKVLLPLREFRMISNEFANDSTSRVQRVARF